MDIQFVPANIVSPVSLYRKLALQHKVIARYSFQWPDPIAFKVVTM